MIGREFGVVMATSGLTMTVVTFQMTQLTATEGEAQKSVIQEAATGKTGIELCLEFIQHGLQMLT